MSSIQRSEKHSTFRSNFNLAHLTFSPPDQWYEEDTPIYVHPKDPTKRIDILPATRPIEIHLDGHVLAKSTHSMHLIEPLIPTRYYLPPTSVDPAILRRSESRSRCPYKGEASYWSLAGIPDAAWTYESPLAEATKIQGHVSFDANGVEVELGPPSADVPTSP